MVRKAKGTPKKKDIIINKNSEKKIFSPNDIIEHCKSRIVDVYIPSMDACIRCQLPVGDAIYTMRASAKTDDEFKKLLFKACLVDFSDKQMEKLEKSDGLRFMELFSMVMGSTDLFTKAMGQGNIKN